MKRIYACIAIVAVLLGVAFYSSWKVQSFAEVSRQTLTQLPRPSAMRIILLRGRPLPMVPPGATRCGQA